MTEKKENVTNTQKLKTVILSVFPCRCRVVYGYICERSRYYDYRFGFEC